MILKSILELSVSKHFQNQAYKDSLKHPHIHLMDTEELQILLWRMVNNLTIDYNNKPKGLKVAKEDQRTIGLMVNRLNGRYARWLIGSMVDRLNV